MGQDTEPNRSGSYIERLRQLVLSDGAIELFALVLEDANAGIQKARYLNERQRLLRKLGEQESLVSKARNLFVADMLGFDDFSEVKREYRDVSGTLKRELDTVSLQLAHISRLSRTAKRSLANIFSGFQDLDFNTQKLVVDTISPVGIGIPAGSIALRPDSAVSKLFTPKSQAFFSGRQNLIPYRWVRPFPAPPILGTEKFLPKGSQQY